MTLVLGVIAIVAACKDRWDMVCYAVLGAALWAVISAAYEDGWFK